MSERFGEQFLHQQDPELHISEVVEHEKERLEKKSEETSQKPAEKIADWLKLLERTHTGHRDNSEVSERIKNYYHKEHVMKLEEIPESAFLLEQRIARELGHGDIEITDEFKERKTEQIINDQTKSLDKWIDYLTSPDADVYPTWAKYWAFTSMVKMGKFEKKEDENGNETARFQKRTKDTISAFPPLNPRALAMTFGVIAERAEEKQKPKKDREPVENKSVRLDDKQFKELLSTENFSKIYSQFLIEMPEYSTEGLKETRGKWVKYDQGSEPDELVKSLEGHPLEWCTANPDTARTQLEGGDFYIYYSYSNDDKPENPSIPRVAIRMEGNNIAEVRGIAADQNMDPYINDVVEKKMKDFGLEGEEYKNKSADMKQLTNLAEKIETGQELTKNELKFLYEVDASIEGFGYEVDPRIEELRSKRDKINDYVTIFGCRPEQVAFDQSFEFKEGVLINHVTDDTVVYAGDNFGVDKKWPKKLKYVLGDVNFFDMYPINSLGALEYVRGNVHLEHCKAKSLGNLRTIIGSLYIDEESEVQSLGRLEMIYGEGDFRGAKLKSLGKLKRVGKIDLSGSDIESLGELETVKGEAVFNNSKVKSLGKLKEILGDASFSFSVVEDLGELKTVGGDCYCNGIIFPSDFSDVKVFGEVFKSEETFESTENNGEEFEADDN